MKNFIKYTLSALCFGIVIPALAQNSDATTGQNSEEPHSGKKRFYVSVNSNKNADAIATKTDSHYLQLHTYTQNGRVTTQKLLLDIGLNTLTYHNNPSLPPALSALELNAIKSWFVNVGLVKQSVRLTPEGKNNKLSLDYALYYENNDYRFNNQIHFAKSDSLQQLTYSKADPGDKNFLKNKLTTRFLSVPLSLRYKSNSKDADGNSFHAEMGVSAGYRLTSFFKTVKNENGKSKQKERDDFYLNNLRYAVFVRVGYGKFCMYACYYLTPMFRDNTAPDLNTVSVGMTVNNIY